MAGKTSNTKEAGGEQKTQDTAPNNAVSAQRSNVPPASPASKVFERGIIRSWNPGSWTAMVQIGDSDKIEPATWAVGSIFSSLFGLKTSFHPELGTDVLVLRTEDDHENYIISSCGNPSVAESRMKDQGSEGTASESGLGVLAQADQQEQRGDALNRKDRVYGEYDLMNGYGVGISFLQNLVRMRSSELAMVETHLMDDLVRIVSDNFQHINAFGEFSIVNDGGRPTVKWRGSSNLYETEGKERPVGEPIGDPGDPFDKGAKTRFESYIGHLGNIFHAFVAEPAKTIGEAAAGRFRAHVNEDGSFLMQSVGDIIFEKAVRIQVPAEKYTADDPQGDKLADMEYEPHDSLKTWIAEDPENLFYESYKLRDYARWMNNWFSLAQFHRSKTDYEVPTESGSPRPTVDNGEDIERPNSGLVPSHNIHIQTYSTIRMFKDGTILMLDGYGSSMHMGGGDLTLSASRHLRLESAGDTIITAGRDLIVKAYKNIDIASIRGGITMRARKWLRMVAEKAEALLESLANESDLDENSEEKNALIIRTRYESILVDAEQKALTMRSRLGMRLKAFSGLLFEGAGCLFRGFTDNNLFSISQAGITADRMILENNLVANQVIVKTTQPIPLMGGSNGNNTMDSAVWYDEKDTLPSVKDMQEPVESVLEDLITHTDQDGYFPDPGSIVFYHHEEYEEAELPKSITQKMLSSLELPVTMDKYFADYRSDFTTGKLLLEDAGSISPGDSGTELTYSAQNKPMHEPSSVNQQRNSGDPLTPESWKHVRLKSEDE